VAGVHSHVCYKKYSVNPVSISSVVVGRPRPE